MPTIARSGLAALVLLATVAMAAASQDAPAAAAPCQDQPCFLSFDWGNGASAASFSNDRRYGAPADFEAALRQTLVEHGLRITDDEKTSKMNIILRMTMMSAICDFMPGTNTDRTCKTVRDVALNFVNSDPAAKKIGAQRVTNRCGANDQAMTTTQFGRFTALVIDYLIEGEAKKLQRPAPKC
jgi:hypothetical protein